MFGVMLDAASSEVRRQTPGGTYGPAQSAANAPFSCTLPRVIESLPSPHPPGYDSLSSPVFPVFFLLCGETCYTLTSHKPPGLPAAIEQRFFFAPALVP